MVGSPQALPSRDDKSHLRYDTVMMAFLEAALAVDRRRGGGLRLGVTGDNGGEHGEEIHRW